jgi:DNA-binding response OmpR family regulator
MGMNRKLIAVVDDEPDILELVSVNLSRANFDVRTFEDAASFLKFVEREMPHVVILDLMLPDADGFEVCKALKKDPRLAGVPVIMLTAKGEETDKVLGLEIGADDYVTKPFSPKELVARVKAVLRRGTQEASEGKVELRELVLDPEKFEVTVGGRPVALTTTEFRILHLLAAYPGRVFSREKILDHLWGREKAVIDRTVDVHVKNLREKLGKAGRMVKNIRGIGYKLDQ